MYSYEDRIRAVKFYINCGYNAAYTVSKLGYPDASNLKHWYREYSEANDLHKGRKKLVNSRTKKNVKLLIITLLTDEMRCKR